MGLDLFIQVIFLFVFCLVLAALETQIEGEAGWAQNLPTWRPHPQKLIQRLYGKILQGRDLTGYHIFVAVLVLVFLHYPYFTGKIWSFSSELTTFSFLFLVAVVWDFLWFVINPRYDFGRFWGQHVLWHKKWFWHMPIDYWFALIISGLFYAKFSLNWALLREWLQIIAVFSILTLVVIIFAIIGGIFHRRKNAGNQ